MELIDYKSKDTIIGITADKNDLVIRCCCNDKHTTYFFSRKTGYCYNLLKNLVEDFPDVTLFQQELTPEELRSIEPKPTIIMDKSPCYIIIAHNDSYNVFRWCNTKKKYKYFVYKRNSAIITSTIYYFYYTIVEAIEQLIRLENTPITCFYEKCNEDELNEVKKDFNIHFK